MDTSLNRLRKFAWLARAKAGIVTSFVLLIATTYTISFIRPFSPTNLILTAGIYLIAAESIVCFKKQLKKINSTRLTDQDMMLLFQEHDNPATIRWILLIACIGLLVWQVTAKG